jgi:hypothetical protein
MARAVSGAAERRRSPRAPVRGRVVLHGDHAPGSGTIENLSLGGVMVRVFDVPARTDVLDIELHLPTTTTIRLSGRAVRSERRDSMARVAIKFDDVDADAEDAIADEVVAAYAAAQRRPVLLIDDIEDRRIDVAAALRDRQMTPLIPTTPLEAIDLLSSPERHVEVCLMSSRFGDHRGREIANVIVESFPWVKIMYVGSDAATVADDVAATWDEIEQRAWRSPA